MFGIGIQELLLIFVVAMIVLGPKKLPELAKTLGKAAREFRNASNDLKQAIGLDDDPETVTRPKSTEAAGPTKPENGPDFPESSDKSGKAPSENDHAGC